MTSLKRKFSDLYSYSYRSNDLISSLRDKKKRQEGKKGREKR